MRIENTAIVRSKLAEFGIIRPAIFDLPDLDVLAERLDCAKQFLHVSEAEREAIAIARVAASIARTEAAPSVDPIAETGDVVKTQESPSGASPQPARLADAMPDLAPVLKALRLIIWFLALIVMLLLASLKVHAQDNTVRVEVQQAGTRVKLWAAGTARLNCSTGVTCTLDAANGRINITTSGGSGSITVGTTTISGGTTARVLYDNAGVVGEYTISGTGSVAMTASPAFTGTVAAASATFSGTIVQTNNSGTIFAAGRQGATNPVFSLVTSGGSDTTGVSVTAASGGSGVVISATSSSPSETLTLTSKGTANLTLTGSTVVLNGLADMSAGGFRSVTSSNGMESNISRFGTTFGSAHSLFWTAGVPTAAPVLGLRRNADAVLEVNNGTAGRWGSMLVGFYGSATNSISNGLTVGTRSSGTPAAGLGAGILFNIDSSTTADQNAAQIAASWSTATHASRSADVVVYNVNNAAALAETFRFPSYGGGRPKSVTFSNLPGGPTNGDFIYCSDCAQTSAFVDDTCTSGGSGAMAIRINGAWKCFQ